MMRTLKEIEEMQKAANIKYEAAKKIAKILEEAKREWLKANEDAEDADWQEELETLKGILFEE